MATPEPGRPPPDVSVTVPCSVPVTVWAPRRLGQTRSRVAKNRIARLGKDTRQVGLSDMRPPVKGDFPTAYARRLAGSRSPRSGRLHSAWRSLAPVRFAES